MGLTHVVFGLFLFLLFWRYGLVGFDESFSGVVLGVLVVGSVLPDLDHPVGLLYSLFGVPRWLRRGVGKVVGQRGFLHTVWMAALVLVLGYLVFGAVLGFGFVAGFGLFVGFLGHLILDSLTVRGVAWLSPLSRRRVWFVVGTGTVIERIFFYVLVVISVVVGYPLIAELFEFVDLGRVWLVIIGVGVLRGLMGFFEVFCYLFEEVFCSFYRPPCLFLFYCGCYCVVGCFS